MNLQGMDELKEGDTVFVIDGGYSRAISVWKVTNVTKTMFDAKINELELRFRKKDGMRYGGMSSRWYRRHAYPDNPKNRAQYNQYLEDQRVKARVRDLMSEILPAIKKLREKDLDKIEAIAAILLDLEVE